MLDVCRDLFCLFPCVVCLLVCFLIVLLCEFRCCLLVSVCCLCCLVLCFGEFVVSCLFVFVYVVCSVSLFMLDDLSLVCLLWFVVCLLVCVCVCPFVISLFRSVIYIYGFLRLPWGKNTHMFKCLCFR